MKTEATQRRFENQSSITRALRNDNISFKASIEEAAAQIEALTKEVLSSNVVVQHCCFRKRQRRLQNKMLR